MPDRRDHGSHVEGISSYTACQAECQALPEEDCSHWDYNKDNGQCVLLWKPEDEEVVTMFHPHYISGPRNC